MQKRINIIAPIGQLPSSDPELRRRLEQLPKDAPLSDVFKVISEREKETVKRSRQTERTKKSGMIHPICPFGMS